MRIPITFIFVVSLVCVLFILTVNVSAAQLDVQYSESDQVRAGGDQEYTHPALVIDNHAYLREQEERRKSGYTVQQGAPIIIINNNVSSKNYHYGKHGYMRDDSWAVGYSSGGTSFYYVNGLRPNCCGPYTIIDRPMSPVRPVPYGKRRGVQE